MTFLLHFRRLAALLIFLSNTQGVWCQDPGPALRAALDRLLADPAMRYALLGVHVEEAGTGRVLLSHGARTGLVPASSQKVVTAATALEMLGVGFRYETKFAYAGTPKDGVLAGPLTVIGDGDPTLGSDRYPSTRMAAVAAGLTAALDRAGIRRFSRGIEGRVGALEAVTIPSGWIWEDLGNYYGAGHGTLNWQENRFTLWLRPGVRAGDSVKIDRTDPAMRGTRFQNELVSGAAGSGDNAYLFMQPGTGDMAVRGSVPCCIERFRISGAVMDPVRFALRNLQVIGRAEGDIAVSENAGQVSPTGLTVMHTHHSPGLDSIIHHFLRESVNLFGEALVHSISRSGSLPGNYDDGISRLVRHWQERGVDPGALRMEDGSGLSPRNRVTADALVHVLQHARTRSWYPVFEHALPIHDGMRMKSGSMTGVRSYAGYARGTNGRVWVFAVISNNFSGSGAAMARKLRELLSPLAR